MELKGTILLLLLIKGTVPFHPAQAWERLQRPLRDAGRPALSGLAGPELSSQTW
jgi:hypothetical protein